MTPHLALGGLTLAAVFSLLPAMVADAQVRQRYPDPQTPAAMAPGTASGSEAERRDTSTSQYGVPAADQWRRQSPYPGGTPWWGYGQRYAFDRGFQEGYDEGFKAGRKYDRFDPYREKDYRRGDVGYDRRYGSRDDYRRQFRSGFEAGYSRGYRDGRRERYDRSGGWRW